MTERSKQLEEQASKQSTTAEGIDILNNQNKKVKAPKAHSNGTIEYKGITYKSLQDFKKMYPDVEVPTITPKGKKAEGKSAETKSEIPKYEFSNNTSSTAIEVVKNGNKYEVKCGDKVVRTFYSEKLAKKFAERNGADLLRELAPTGDVTTPKGDPVKPEVKPEVKKQGKGLWTSIRDAFKKGCKGKGKIAMITAGVLAAGAAITYFATKSSDDKEAKNKTPIAAPEQNQAQEQTVPAQQDTQETPTAPITTTPPAAEAPETPKTKYEVKEGDNVWNIAKKQIIEKHKDEPDFNISKANAEIRKLTEKIIEENNLKWEDDNYRVIIKPKQELNLAA